ncbi:MAG: 3-phosphoshikimate 1-carboxyvinyltransferase [Planctomycetota bacterium]|nr:MAG: 3-phosphoshikimate 1-carboxyvinyltransferase [Planctomycetota bacterium]
MLPPGPLTIPPLHRELAWTWPVPGSKSLTNRALPLAALASGTSRLTRVLHSDDTGHMRQCLQQWGIGFADDDAQTLTVHGGRERLHASATPLEVGNSGTTVRFCSALAALVPGHSELCGDADMARRPIAHLVSALQDLGVRVDCPSGCPPLTVQGTGSLRGSVTIPGHLSSQYASALLLAGAGDEEGIEISIAGDLVSKPYVAMTCAMIRAFGGEADGAAGRWWARGPLQPSTITIEPDATAASYAFAAAVSGQGSVTVPHLGRESIQGDLAFVDILEAMGAQVERGKTRTTVAAGNGLRGIEVDMHHISDTVMTLAAIAPLASGPTTIRNIANIKVKETDRLAATVNELQRLGQDVTYGEDWIRITPARIVPATIECYRDHRMAMSFAILGLARSGISIADPACVAKTYPSFWTHLTQLYHDHGQECPWANCAS